MILTKKKIFSSIFTIIAASLTLTACGNTSASQKAPKQEVNWFETGELSTMDPALNNDVFGEDQLNNTMEGLLRVGNKGKITPGIARSWRRSKSGLTWTFNLRKNAKWANGQPLTAEDFVYAWRRQVNPKTASTQSNKFFGIKNALAIVKSKKPMDSLGVKAEGKNKLVVQLARPLPYFKLLVACPAYVPLNPQFTAKAGKKFGTRAKYLLSDGPFIMKGWTGDNLTWKLVKNPRYWDAKDVSLKQINYSVQKTQTTSYNLYQAKKLDMTTLNTAQSKNLRGTKGWLVRRNLRTQYLIYNMKKDPKLANANLRRAIAAAINKKALAKVINSADQPATSLSSNGITDAVTKKNFAAEVPTKQTENIQNYRPQLARRYYQKALKELGQKRVTLNLLGDDTDDAKKTTEYIQSSLESILGMKVNVQNMPFKNRFSREQTGSFDVILDGWTADYADPSSFLEMFEKGNVNNFGDWENAAYNQAMNTASTTLSTKKRWQALLKAERILLTEQGVTPLYYNSTATLQNPKIKGIAFDGTGSYGFKTAKVVR